MKVLVVSQPGFEYVHGGNLRYIYVIKQLVARGHEVVLLSSKNTKSKNIRKMFGNIKLYKHNFIDTDRFAKHKLIRYFLFLILEWFDVYRVIKKENPKVLFAQTFLSGMVLMIGNFFHRKKTVLDVSDLYHDFFSLRFKTKYNPFTFVFEKLEYYLIKKADRVTTCSCAFKEFLIEKGIKKERISVAYDGVDLSIFKNREKSKEWLNKLDGLLQGK